MKTISVGEFKARMSFFIGKILKGEEFIISYGRKKNKIFKVSPVREEKPFKRKLGILEGKVTVTFSDDWEMSEEELLNL